MMSRKTNGNSKSNNYFSKSRSNNRGYNSRNKRSNKSKEVELNIPESKLNRADLNVRFQENKGENDIQWYSNNPQMLKDVASLPFGNPVGLREIYSKDASHLVPSATGTATPGILTYHIVPGIGVATTNTDAANIAAQQLYTLIRKANSGATNYDKTDVMMVMLAMDSAYMMYEHFVRAYKIIPSYDYLNRYFPDAILREEHFSATELRANLANFRYLINSFAYQLASINVPDQFDFIKRHSWLFSNLYTDDDVQKAQVYQFVPKGFYVWTEGDGTNPAYLKFRDISDYTTGGILDMAHIEKIMNDIMQPLLGSQDVGTISGDIAKAFGDGGMISISPISEHEMITPYYNMEVITQMMNATFTKVDTSTLDITQDLSNVTSGPMIQWNPYIVGAGLSDGALYCKRVLNVKDNVATPDLSMIATRLVATYDTTKNAEGNYAVISCGTELVDSATIMQYTYTTNGLPNMLHIQLDQYLIASPGEGYFMPFIQQVVALSKFDNYPTMYVCGANSTSGTQFYGVMQDLSNYTILEDSDIETLNEVAIYSLFQVKDYNSKF